VSRTQAVVVSEPELAWGAALCCLLLRSCGGRVVGAFRLPRRAYVCCVFMCMSRCAVVCRGRGGLAPSVGRPHPGHRFSGRAHRENLTQLTAQPGLNGLIGTSSSSSSSSSSSQSRSRAANAAPRPLRLRPRPRPRPRALSRRAPSLRRSSFSPFLAPSRLSSLRSLRSPAPWSTLEAGAAQGACICICAHRTWPSILAWHWAFPYPLLARDGATPRALELQQRRRAPGRWTMEPRRSRSP
jgi:hypothetical protein